VKQVLVAEPSEFVRQRPVVVLCGDLLLHRKLLSDSVSKAAGLSLVRCAEDRNQVFSLCQQLNASLFVARQTFIEQIPSADFQQLTNFGKGRNILVILEGDDMDPALAAKMLRIGCRGVLPRQFSSKLLRRAVLAILKGELWAPRVVVSELLSELLRASSVKAENGLTPQEARILELTSQGFKNSAIADRLFISLETVRWHKRRLNRKLRGPDRVPQQMAAPPNREMAAG
jgi:DNA-binding NarL/FixJ family response regulator